MRIRKALAMLRWKLTSRSAFANLQRIGDDIARREQALLARRRDVARRAQAVMDETRDQPLLDRAPRIWPVATEINEVELGLQLIEIEKRAFTESLDALSASIPKPQLHLRIVKGKRA